MKAVPYPFEPGDPCLADGAAQHAAIGDGRQTRAGFARCHAERAHATNPAFHAFSDLRPVEAIVADAGARDEAHGRTIAALLDGLTFSVKGNIPVAGRRWTEGSRVFEGRVATETAPVVQRLLDAGAILTGITTLSELAFYAADNPFEPLALNPWSPRRTSGGSTAGGGAAAALGAATLHLGTDSGGSIRNPACHCGIVGFKPTLKRWPREGIPSYAPSLGALGIIARSVADVAAVDRVIAGDAPRGVQPRMLLVPEQLIAEWADEPTAALFATAIDRLKADGWTVEAFDEPVWTAGERAAGVVSIAEGALATASLDAARMAPALAGRLQRRRGIPADAIAEARAAMAALAQALTRLVPPGALIATPMWPFRAPYVRQVRAMVRGRSVPMDPHRNVFVRAANAADAPAISLPAGFYPGRVPFGLQLLAPTGRDGDVLAAAAAVERALGANQRIAA